MVTIPRPTTDFLRKSTQPSTFTPSTQSTTTSPSTPTTFQGYMAQQQAQSISPVKTSSPSIISSSSSRRTTTTSPTSPRPDIFTTSTPQTKTTPIELEEERRPPQSSSSTPIISQARIDQQQREREIKEQELRQRADVQTIKVAAPKTTTGQQQIIEDKKETPLDRTKTERGLIVEAPSRRQSLISYIGRMGGGVIKNIYQETKDTFIGFTSLTSSKTFTDLLKNPEIKEKLKVDVVQAEKTAKRNLAILGTGAAVGFAAPVVLGTGATAAAVGVAGKTLLGGYIVTQAAKTYFTPTEEAKTDIISRTAIDLGLFTTGSRIGTSVARTPEGTKFIQSVREGGKEILNSVSQIKTTDLINIRPLDKSGAVWRGGKRISPPSKAMIRQGRKDIKIQQTPTSIQVTQRGKGQPQFTAEFERGQIKAFEKTIKQTAIPTRYKDVAGDTLTFAKRSIRVGKRVEIRPDKIIRQDVLREVTTPQTIRARLQDIQKGALPKYLQQQILSQFPRDVKTQLDIKGAGFIRAGKQVVSGGKNIIKNIKFTPKQTFTTETGKGNQLSQLQFKEPPQTIPKGFRSAKIKARLIAKIKAKQPEIKEQDFKTPIKQNEIILGQSRFNIQTTPKQQIKIQPTEEIIRGFKPIETSNIATKTNLEFKTIAPIDTTYKVLSSYEIPKAIILPFSSNLLKQDSNLIETQSITPIIQQDLLQEPTTINRIREPIRIQDTTTILKPELINIQKTQQLQTQDLIQEPEPITITTNVTRTPQRTIREPPKPSIIIPPTPIIKIPPLIVPERTPFIRQPPLIPNIPRLPPTPIIRPPKFNLPTLTQQRPIEKGFLVAVRRFGEFGIVTPKPLSKQEALSFGAFKVGTTAAATFKLIETDKEATGKFTTKYLSNLYNQFYEKEGKFIEKRKFRISTIGELREITFKGLAAQKSKSTIQNLINKIK